MKTTTAQTAALADLDLDVAPRFTKLGTAVVTVDGEKLTVDRQGNVLSAATTLTLLRESLTKQHHQRDALFGRDRSPWTAAINATVREIREVSR